MNNHNSNDYSGSQDDNEAPKSTDRDIENMWQRHNADDVAYQRQAQVTWWALMGGIALGALLTQFDQLLAETQMGNWYYFLYFIATCL